MCPERWRLTPGHLFIVQLRNQARISPLAGYPDKYLAWVTARLALLESAILARQAEAMETVGNGNAG